jgi:O-antigen/teichoic acid export membrane protein
MVSRFILIFFLAKYLSPSDMGIYGLVVATILYALFFVGIDFYTFTTRELPKYEKAKWGALLKNQATLSIMLYFALLPFLSLIFIFDFIPLNFAVWFFPLVLLEYVCQEFIRFFIAVSEQIAASIVMFLRQGLWVIVFVKLMIDVEEYRNLDSLFLLWTISCIFAIFFACLKFHKMKLGGWDEGIDRKWIRAGIKVALPLLVSTLFLRAISTVDRYWIQHLGGFEILGSYVFFIAIASSLLVVLDAIVVSYAYPKLISGYVNSNPRFFKSQIKEMLYFSLMISVVFVLASVSLLPTLLDWIGEDIYLDNIHIFYWLIGGVTLSGFSLIPHFALYAQRKDQFIIRSNISSLVIFGFSTVIISMYYPILAVPLGYLLAQLFVLIYKLQAYYFQGDDNYFGV